MAFRATSLRSVRRPKATSRFLAGLRPRKAPDRAIEIATGCGMPLKIAAKIDRVDQAYWEEKIRPMVEANADIEFIGEIGESDKADFLGGAAALLFRSIGRSLSAGHDRGDGVRYPCDCLSPQVGFRNRSGQRVGFIVDTVEEAVAAVRRVADLDRVEVRAAFERRFTAERMAATSVALYRQLLAGRTQPVGVAMLNGTHPASHHVLLRHIKDTAAVVH